MNGPYDLNSGLKSRSISFENQTGERSAGGTKASNLGIGRKGYPSKQIQSGETIQLCNITGPGTIRHIWLTTRPDPEILRSIVLRAYWENQIHPSIECPIGDFMGYAHGKVMPYQSAVHSIGEKAGMNFWLQMPFTKCGHITFTNEGSTTIPLFYQIDYTIGDNHPFDVGRLHCLFRRENPTHLKKDFELLPKRVGKGRFIGSIIGIRSLNTDYWWGEGEFKVYLDGDTDFPTICGTGSEDYVGLSWEMQQTPFFYHGCSLDQNGFISMYRWHLLDPIYWYQDCHITIQQIGWDEGRLFERKDDWSCASFWYESIPSTFLPKIPSVNTRIADIWQEEPKI